MINLIIIPLVFLAIGIGATCLLMAIAALCKLCPWLPGFVLVAFAILTILGILGGGLMH